MKAWSQGACSSWESSQQGRGNSKQVFSGERQRWLCDWCSRRACAEGRSLCLQAVHAETGSELAGSSRQDGWGGRRSQLCLCSELAAALSRFPWDRPAPRGTRGWQRGWAPGSAPAATSLLETGPSDAQQETSIAQSAGTPRHSDETTVVLTGHSHPTAPGCSWLREAQLHWSGCHFCGSQ